jgi:hypothetical protein
MQLNEQTIMAIMESTPAFMRGRAISGRAIRQGRYKALDIYLEQIPSMQGVICQLVATNNYRII